MRKKIPDNQKQALEAFGSANLFEPSGDKAPEALRQEIQSYLKVASAEPQKFGGSFSETSPNQYDPNYTKYNQDTLAMDALVKALENPHNEVLRANFTKAYGVQDGQNLIEEVKNGFAQDLKEFSKIHIEQLGSHLTRDPEKQKRINGLAEQIKGAQTPEAKEAALESLLTVAAARREWFGLSSEVKSGSDGISKSTTSVSNLIDLLEKDKGLREQLGLVDDKGAVLTGNNLKRHVFEKINDIKRKEHEKEALARVGKVYEGKKARLDARLPNEIEQISEVLQQGGVKMVEGAGRVSGASADSPAVPRRNSEREQGGGIGGSR